MATNDAGSFELIAIELAHAIEPLAGRLHDTHHALILLGELGLALPEQSVTPALETAFQELHKAAHDLPDTRQALVDAIGSGATVDIIAKGVSLAGEIALILDAFERLATQISALGAVPGVSSSDLNAFVAALPKRLFETVLVGYLEDKHKLIASLAEFGGVIEKTRLNVGSTDPGQPGYLKKEVHFDRLGDALKSPDQRLKDLYGWGEPTFDGPLILGRVADILQALRVPITRRQLRGPPPRPAIEICVATIAPTAGVTPLGLDVLFAMDVGDGMTIEFPIVAGLRTHLVGKGGIAANAGLRLQPPANVSLRPPSGSAQGSLTAGIVRLANSANGAISLLGLTAGTSLSAQRIELDLLSEFRWDSNNNQARGDFGFAGLIRGGKLKVGMEGADGFLEKILANIAVEAGFDLGMQWTAGQSVSFTGSSALEVKLPTHISLGPIDLTAITFSVGLEGDKFPIGVTTDIKAALGPITGVVEELGASVDLSFPASGRGDIGPLSIGFRFKPPKGVGLSLDGGVVSGGGYLFIDTDRGQYAGVLQLNFADFLTVTAIGLIQTKMPDGSKGFSLLIVIDADFGAGIQLGFGFTLNAVGGLLGLNRAMLFQPIMDGIRTNAISSVMFPTDVIANAPRIISDLQAFFPPKEGTFLIGPMAKIGWGEPTLISLSLGVIVEIPPGDIAILGVLRVSLPAEELPILKLQVNFAGALEFDKKRLYFYASLFDSHLLFMTIDGSMGLLFAYGDDANFVLSVGGFHPAFKPPPLPFPTPVRVSLDIINESYARIHADGYFAVTTNTAQFGTHSNFFFGFSALSVEGSSGFDALIQFSPFHFTVSISTSFSVKVFGLGVYGVDISLTLEGPGRWHASGSASLSFFFFSVDIGIDFSWGDDQDTTLPPVAVMPLLTAELQKQSNWRAVLPAGSNLLVSLRKLDPVETDFVLHPVGVLQISQRLVPLDLTLDKFGNRKPTDANRFSVSVISPGLSKSRDLQESFAPAQFRNTDDAGKLSAPAYEPQDSGIELAVAGVAYASGTAITRTVRYDLTVIDTKLRRSFLKFFNFAGGFFLHLLRGASVAFSPLSNFRAAQTHPYAGAVALAPEKFAVALASDNTVFSAEAASFSSMAAANDYLARTVKNDPTLAGTIHVLPHFELAA